MSANDAQAGTAQWYAVKLLFSSSVGDTTSLRPLCEERVVLFSCATESGARKAADRYARIQEHSYKNAVGENVKWAFASIEKIDALEDPSAGHGWEVASKFVRRSLRTLRLRKPGFR